MFILLVVLEVLILIVLVVMLLRKPIGAPPVDPRAAQIPDQLARLETRSEAKSDALGVQVRDGLAEIRREAGENALQAREAAARDAGLLRAEVTASIATLGTTLRDGLADFRGDNKASAEALRRAVQENLDAIAQRLGGFISEATRNQLEAREALNTKLTELGAGNAQKQDSMRAAMEDRLERLNVTNAAKLEEMRQTVDEKLHATLHTRLTESFGAVSDQLMKVHSGLGEMTALSSGVNDLNRIFSNVKSRGGIAEVQLGRLLEQILAPTQFQRNVAVKPGTGELVEYAVRFPGATGETLLPIDAKFPREAWERLETAYEAGVVEEVAAAGRAFEAAIRTEGKRICSKYINEPVTTPHAIMFLPTESLYAEVVRRDGLQADLQSNCQVTIAGPSTLSAILISFQMGFHMLNLQKKGSEVWKVLAKTRTEFGKFEGLMDSMEKQVGTVQGTIEKLGVRTRAINRTLREVGEDQAEEGSLLGFDGVVAQIAAGDGEA